MRQFEAKGIEKLRATATRTCSCGWFEWELLRRSAAARLLVFFQADLDLLSVRLGPQQPEFERRLAQCGAVSVDAAHSMNAAPCGTKIAWPSTRRHWTLVSSAHVRGYRMVPWRSWLGDEDLGPATVGDAWTAAGISR